MTKIKTTKSRQLPTFWGDLEIFSFIWPGRQRLFIFHGLMMVFGFYLLWQGLGAAFPGTGLVALSVTMLACMAFLFGGFLSFSRLLSLPYFLYRRSKMLALKYGVPARGKVLSIVPVVSEGQVHGNMLIVNYEYTGSDGVTRQGHEYKSLGSRAGGSAKAGRRLDGAGLKEGESLLVLYDPLEPERSSLPHLYDLALDEVGDGQAIDSRVHWPTSPGTKLMLEGLGAAIRVPLDVQTGGGRQAWWEVAGRGSKSSRMGHFEIDDERILVAAPHLDEVEISLMEPFVVRLEAWLRSNEEAELIVSLRARNASGTDGDVRFKVVLQQENLNGRVPLRARPGTPFMRLEDFEKVWPAIRAAAQLHGEVVEDLVRLDGKEAVVDQVVSATQRA